MKEYDVFVPLNYNDGTPVEPNKFERLQRRLLAHFDGVTFFLNQIKDIGNWAGSHTETKSSFTAWSLRRKKKRGAF